ncbi:hypothetical protein [Acaryochloris marina]|uniref:Uncharacterized protein n=1 Tax=Acaryochloris marina (strain MBIC 11017) TaxID=329726 RepID=A8ZLI1_ACAM1|nr:hypothetical protein [Acaryochloris marina]ABW32008.1 hypothetical protein AM1_B0289 [Acaryochloris marina MBIC11017]
MDKFTPFKQSQIRAAKQALKQGLVERIERKTQALTLARYEDETMLHWSRLPKTTLKDFLDHGGIDR